MVQVLPDTTKLIGKLVAYHLPPVSCDPDECANSSQEEWNAQTWGSKKVVLTLYPGEGAIAVGVPGVC